jgi:hypothetical protein
MEEQVLVARRSLPRWRIISLALILLLLALFLALWSQRKDIASGFIDRELSRRGVAAHYEIRALGFGRQRLENVRIGDPAHPDLTARWVEVQLSYGLRAPRVSAIRARGVRIIGRLVDGQLSLGQIDKMLPPPSGAPFQFPDLRLDFTDTVMRLDTPAGRIGIAMAGHGNLADGFRGRAAAAARQLTFGDCSLAAPVASLRVSVFDRRPSLAGPLRTSRLACGDSLDIQAPVVTVDAKLAEALDSWDGRAAIAAPIARSGSNLLGQVQGTVSFAGNAKRTRGRLDLAGAAGRFGDIRTARVAFDGGYDYLGGQGQVVLAGNAEAAGVVVGSGPLAPALAALGSLAATPLEPAGKAIAAALTRAVAGFDARTDVRLVQGPAGTLLRLGRLNATSRSGAQLAIAAGEGLTIDTSNGAIRLDGRLTLAGGGFPTTEAVLSQPRVGAPLSGTARVAPFATPGGGVGRRAKSASPAPPTEQPASRPSPGWTGRSATRS